MLNLSPVADSTQVYPTSILPELVSSYGSGRATFCSLDDETGWRIHFSNGQIHFATTLEGQSHRLRYLLSHLLPHFDWNKQGSDTIESDYQYLFQIWRSGHISAQQLRQILLSFTQEALVYLLSMSRANLKLESSLGLDPILISVPFSPLLQSIHKSVQDWMQVRGTVLSPMERLQVINIDPIIESWQSKNPNSPTNSISFVDWQKLLTDNLTLYEVAYLLRVNLLDLMAHVQKWLIAGAATLVPYRLVVEEVLDERPLIACIDDSKTMRAIIRSVLEQAGYQVLEIMSASQAVETLSQSQPSVILMDISMPEVDGYELCSTLKRSSMKDIPVVMLTGREGVIDRVRAHLVGATAYITKPFDPNQLVSLVQQLILAA